MKNPTYTRELINSTNGLFIEELAYMQIYSTEWKIVTQLNLSHFVEEMHHLETILGAVETVCTDIEKHFVNRTDRSTCRQTIQQVNNMLKDSKEYSSEWFMSKTKTRTKRGQLNIVGSTAKALFGVLTEDDGKLYIEQFRELEKQQRAQEVIGEKQTTLIKTTFESIEDYLNLHGAQKDSMNKEVNELKKIMMSIDNFFTSTIEEQQKLLIMNNKLHSIMDLFILIMMQFERKQAMFLESIAAGQRSPNSPVLIPPELLRKELKDRS